MTEPEPRPAETQPPDGMLDCDHCRGRVLRSHLRTMLIPSCPWCGRRLNPDEIPKP